nr:signal peptidase I [Pseudoruegeria sp. HB172150]
MADWLDWDGRTGRREFGIFLAIYFATGVIAQAISAIEATPEAIRVALVILLALLLYPLAGFSVRRFHDIGVSGLNAFWVFVPVVGLVVLAVLLIKPSRDNPDLEIYPAEWPIAGLTLLTLIVLFAASRIFWQPVMIPSGSMKPTLLIGDYLVATHFPGMPRRGDVVVYQHPERVGRHISRVIGLPGETVQLRDGAIFIDGTVVDSVELEPFVEIFEEQGPMDLWPQCTNFGPAPGSDCIKRRRMELLPDGESHAVLDIRNGPLDNTPSFEVPEGHVVLISDNRDNAVDSRLPPSADGVGFLPVGNIIAKVRLVVFSTASTSPLAVWAWRPGRYFEVVE